MKKKIVVTCGPIPARLDSVKFITNMFKGGLAIRTAKYLAGFDDSDVTVVKWKNTRLPDELGQDCHVVDVTDVFEYYDWIVVHARDYDAFVMAAAVANLTPVHPYKTKFPSHDYKPGDEFNIPFMIAPRAIDAIKPLNPRACVIGYKLFDEPDDNKLAEIAMHTLSDAKANVIFANRPSDAKIKKLAVLADGSVIPMSFDEHLEFIRRAIFQTYFRTEIEPLAEDELKDPDIREALAAVKAYENTFEKYGTVAIPVENHPGMFATTSRGHLNDPVIVRDVDIADKIVTATGKATLNAPALAAMLGINPGRIIIHRHFDDPCRDKNIETGFENGPGTGNEYVFPGTVIEYAMASGIGTDVLICPHHGYLKTVDIVPVNWQAYYETFPERYFKLQEAMKNLVNQYRAENKDVLEIGGNRHPVGNYSFDPYVMPDPDSGAKYIGYEDMMARKWDLTVCFNAVNYLSGDEIRRILSVSETFIANTFALIPDEQVREQEYAVHDMDRQAIRHGLVLKDDSLMRHGFHAYTVSDFNAMGLTCKPYGSRSMLVFRDNTGNVMFRREDLERHD